jgi:AcrR family transcriptional regulator
MNTSWHKKSTEGEGQRSVAVRSVERALEGRYATYLEEVSRLVEAGVRVMQRNGDFEPPVNEILREAGLSNQAFYRHFKSKDEFLLAVLDNGVRELVSYLQHRMEGVESATERIRRWIEGLLAQGLNPEAAEATRPFVVPQARLAERFPEEVADSVRQLTVLLAEAIAEGLEVGELSGGDPERDSRAIYDLAMGWLQRSLAEKGVASSEDADHLLSFAMRGLLRAEPER